MAISKIGSKGITDLALTADDLADGTISNDKLAGSIANDKLANSSVTLNGTSVALGGSADIGTQWQSVKTADFTAVAGEGYFIDTTSGAITATLPASPSLGDTVILVQLDGTNSVTVGRNGSNINGAAADSSLTSDGDSTTLVYSNASEGWKVVNSTIAGTFTSATGGTETTSGDYKIHTFTSSGCFTVSAVGNSCASASGGPSTASYLVIAGGGGGGDGQGGGGGGAGGFREGKDSGDSYTASPIAATSGVNLTTTTYPITVGAGGAGRDRGACAQNYTNPGGASGSNSVFSTITSAGGGGGGHGAGDGQQPGVNGGSGGGGGGRSSPGSPGTANAGGSGNTPPVSPSQGNNGGGSNSLAPTCTTYDAGGGGGGAGAVGASVSPTTGPGGNGGNGVASSITGSSVTRAGGGGGGACHPSQSAGTGGSGGGGAGRAITGSATSGTSNTGGGGGGSGQSYNSSTAGSGGSGIVIIRYKYQ